MGTNQNDIQPPRWSLHLLRLFIRKDFLEEIEGDMEEVFIDDLEQHTVKKAKRRYLKGVLKLMRPSLTRLLSGTQKINHIGMLQHYLLISLRGFRRHKSTFIINLIGLSTGLAASLLIFLWVNDERSVDTHHAKNDQLYWAFTHFQLSNNKFTWGYTSGKLAQAMLDEFPEVKESLRISNLGHRPKGVIVHENSSYEVEGLFSDPNIFDVFTHPLLVGNKKDLLQDNGAIAISEKTATRIFGNAQSALGQTIQWGNRFFDNSFIVKGVFEDLPLSSSQQYDVIVNYQLLLDYDEWANAWNGGHAQTFLVLEEGTNTKVFNEKIAGFMSDKVNNDKFTVFTRPYAENYLYGQYDNGIQAGGRIENVRIFTIIAIFVLLIACINFMNLSTAQASKKMKEVGVKKAIGANRRSLIFQFLSESVILSLFSLVLAILLVNLLLPQFNEITSKQLEINLIQFIKPMLAIVLITGVLAGSYPAFYLSGFKPITVLKGKASNLKGEEWTRKGLVIVQFVLSIVFIIGVITINRQIEFTQSKDLGYNRENIVTFQRKGQFEPNPDLMLNELNKISGVTSSAYMEGSFISGEGSGSGFSWDPTTEEDSEHLFKAPKVGYNLIETLGIEIVQGRSFSKEFNDDRTKLIINESAAELMGFKEPVGQILDYGSGGTREIIGVVKDFQYGSIHQKIEPLIFGYRDFGANFIVKLQAGTEVLSLQKIEEVYERLHPEYNFSPTYLEDDYMALYSAETKVASLSNYMAGIAIIISCLGLFGLAAFTAERRTKEIGIRKILGASQLVIMRLLTNSFTKTVLISIVLALPLGYFLAKQWLQGFAYSINLEWWFFALAGVAALLIAWITVGFQTLKASLVNPAQCLRNE